VQPASTLGDSSSSLEHASDRLGPYLCVASPGAVVDLLDYLAALARLRIPDALAGPLPETAADQRREREWERLERVFPEIEP
jgi:hypothetical protein